MAREIVLLAGMHRSGTSALARVCNLLGAVLPEPLVPASLGNELGHWEPLEVVEMNDRALLAAGADVNGLHPLSPAWAASPAADAFVEEIGGYLDRVARNGAITVIKDPRISLLAPYWRAGVERAGARPRFVLAYRDPAEVARSLTRRQLQHFPHEVWPPARATALWLKHQLELEHATRGASRSFVGYAGLLADWRGEAERMFGQLDLAWTPPSRDAAEAVDAFLQPDARRQRRTRTDAGSALADETMALLRRAQAAPAGLEGEFDAVTDRFTTALDILGDYLVALETRVDADRRAQDEDGAVVVAALRRAVEQAELRTIERRADPAREGADESAAIADTPEDASLAARYAAVKLAQRRTAAALRAGRAAWDAERARWVAAEQTLREASVEATADGAATSIQARIAAEQADGAVARAGLQAALNLAVADAEAARDRARRQTERADDAERRAHAHAHRGDEAALQVEAALADLQRARQLGRDLQARSETLSQEVEDHRAAYEALREEAAKARARAAGAVAEAARQRGRAEIAEHAAAAHAARLPGLEADRLAGEAALHAAGVETTALRRSASWRLTRPLRSVTFRLRRLAGAR